MDADAGAKPTAAGSHEGPPGAGKDMIDDPSTRNSSYAAGSNSTGDNDSSRARNGGSSSADGGSSIRSVAGIRDGGNRSNSGNSNSGNIGSGRAADADDGSAGQLPRLEANRLNGPVHRRIFP